MFNQLCHLYKWTHALLFILCVVSFSQYPKQTWNQVYQIYEICEWLSEYIGFYSNLSCWVLTSPSIYFFILDLEADCNIRYVIWGSLSWCTYLAQGSYIGTSMSRRGCVSSLSPLPSPTSIHTGETWKGSIICLQKNLFPNRNLLTKEIYSKGNKTELQSAFATFLV